MLCSPALWRFLGMGCTEAPPAPVLQAGGDLQHFHGITYFMKFDLPVSQILSLHQVQKSGVEQLSCFSGDMRSRWKQIHWIGKRCVVRWQSRDTVHWNTGIRNAEKCRILWKFRVFHWALRYNERSHLCCPHPLMCAYPSIKMHQYTGCWVHLKSTENRILSALKIPYTYL